MKTRKTNTNTMIIPKPATLLAALAALTLAGATTAEARTRAADVPSPVEIVNRDQINSVSTQNVSDALNRLPNVVTDTYAGSPYGTNNSNINLRGLGNDRNLVLLNGRRYNPNPEVYGPTGTFTPIDLERVEVLRGPQGTLYGRNPGGAINVITRGGNTYGDDAPGYNLGGNYRYDNNVTDYGIKFDPKALGTERFNTDLTAGLRYNNDFSQTPSVNTDTVVLNPTFNTDYDYEWTPTDTAQGATLNTDPVTDTTTQSTTDTPVATDNTSDNPPASTPCPETGKPVNTTTTQTPNNEVYDWGGTNTYRGGGYGTPCDRNEIDWDRVRNQLANTYRDDAAGTARGLIYQSQPKPFYDFNYYNTANDELANRAVIGYQLSQSLSLGSAYNTNTQGCIVGQPGIPNGGLPPADGQVYVEPEGPKTYYRVGYDFPIIPIDNTDTATTEDNTDDTSTTTTTTERPEETPIPDYKPVVKPIDVNEMTDGQLESEVKYGPGIAGGYLREAAGLRKDSERYRNWAKERREQAARARTDAEEARKKAKEAKKADSREFWEKQAEAYDSHAEILEDSARNLDRAARSNDAAAETYEQDAAQSAANAGQAAGELANRLGQRAARAAQAQAEREAEAARKEAERQRKLDELIRQSQQSSQNNNANNQDNSGSRPNRPYRPDGRVPRPGKESRNETLRKLLD